MDETELAEIERQIAVGRTLPGVNRYDLETMTALVAEVRRLQAVEREAVCVLGAIVSQHDGWRVAVPEEALRRGFTVERVHDPVSLRVVFWAHTEGDADGR